MKLKFITLFAVLLVTFQGVDTYAQQNGYRYRPFFVSVQGGTSFCMSENLHAFFIERQGGKLFRPEGSLSFGHYLANNRYGFRLNVGYAQNMSAGNYQESRDVFTPYSFQNVAVFADAIVNAGDVSKPKGFNCRFFAGLGYAYSFGFGYSDIRPEYSYDLREKNHSFGIRAGLILEYVLPRGIGFFFEPCFEMFTDRFNGESPRFNDRKAGFPFDLKLNASLGISYHF